MKLRQSNLEEPGFILAPDRRSQSITVGRSRQQECELLVIAHPSLAAEEDEFIQA